MSPDHLVTNYDRYKAATDQIASWLASTAKECGVPADLVHTPAPPASTAEKAPRLKGKARKLAKQEGQTKAEFDNDVSLKSACKPRYSIPLKNFLPLARQIAAYCKPPVTVPSWFCEALDKAISLRKVVGENINAVESLADKDSNDRHCYFIDVLEGVREALRVRMVPNKRDVKVDFSPIGQTPQERLINVFSLLEVQDPDENLETECSASASEDASMISQPTYVAERSIDLTEALFAFTCLLNDLNRIRTVITDTWVKFKDGAVDLVSAAITSNTALELARHLESELTIIKKHGGSEAMLRKFYIAHSLDTPAVSSRTLSADEMLEQSTFESYDDMERFFFPAYQHLKNFQEIYDLRAVCVPRKETHLGSYDPSADRSKMTPNAKYREDLILLGEIVPYFSPLSILPERLPSDDELVRGMLQMFKGGEVSLSLVFSVQVYYDIHHALRGHVKLAYEHLVKMSNAIYATIDQNTKFHGNLKHDNWSPACDKAIQMIQHYISFHVRSDPFERWIKCHSTDLVALIEEQGFLKRYPIRCGLGAYYIKATFNDVAIRFANTWGSIFSISHLYNAMHQEKLLKDLWQDMELLFFVQNVEYLFAGEVPKSADEYLKRLALVNGYGAVNFARGRRTHIPITSSGVYRTLERHAEVSRMFFAKYVCATGQNDMSAGDIAKILERSHWLACRAEDNEVMILEKRSKNKTGFGVNKSSLKINNVSISRLLNDLRLALQAELPEFSFDYMSLHRQCWRLLQSLKASGEPEISRKFGDFFGKEIRLPELVKYALGRISQNGHCGPPTGLPLGREACEAPSRALLERSAQHVNAMLVRQPGIESTPSEIATDTMRKVYGFDLKIEKPTVPRSSAPRLS